MQLQSNMYIKGTQENLKSSLYEQLPFNSGHSTHFQIGGDNPKVEGQEFLYPSPGSD